MAKQKLTTSINIRIDDPDYEKIYKIAVKNQWSLNKVINNLIKTSLK